MILVQGNTKQSPETRAKTITIGTNTPETLSASLAIGALILVLVRLTGII